ncbi:hypothetical protein Xish_03665 [Xenorhabdus ishibashii]|uniref:Uncharacterized protein n=1 Tax=Xenorhabdus ishibashii TaxID=1034471 RepID=A0A2D0K7X1_9GAMM|nr:hypothetical protein Xish_03665 [Xenorhabdus ishibashii]
MSNEMITVAKFFARGFEVTFPLMTMKQLGEFIHLVKQERLSLPIKN